jgi:hypothetical protein
MTEKATFTGTFEEFNKFIGPRLRNIVQTSIAPKYKKKIGKCQGENCGTNEKLHAAHVYDKERKELMKQACAGYEEKGRMINMSLEDFEHRFKKLHEPLEETFIILCETCHKKYDNNKPK